MQEQNKKEPINKVKFKADETADSQILDGVTEDLTAPVSRVDLANDFEEQDQYQDEHSVVTSCCDCVFAEYEGSSQVSCKQNKFEVFEKRGIQILPAENLIKEFNLVKASCYHYRPPVWGDAYEGKEQERLKKELEVTYNIGVIVDDENPLSKLKTTVKSILKQGYLPKRIVVAINTNPKKNDGEETHKKVLEVIGDLDITVNTVKLTPDFYTLDNEDVNSGIVDEMFSRFRNGYYVILQSGKELKEGSMDALSQAVGYHQYAIPVVLPTDGINGLTVQALIHKTLGGSRHFDLQKKARDFQAADSLDIIRTWDEVFEISKTGEYSDSVS